MFPTSNNSCCRSCRRSCRCSCHRSFLPSVILAVGRSAVDRLLLLSSSLRKPPLSVSSLLMQVGVAHLSNELSLILTSDACNSAKLRGDVIDGDHFFPLRKSLMRGGSAADGAPLPLPDVLAGGDTISRGARVFGRSCRISCNSIMTLTFASPLSPWAFMNVSRLATNPRAVILVGSQALWVVLVNVQPGVLHFLENRVGGSLLIPTVATTPRRY